MKKILLVTLAALFGVSHSFDVKDAGLILEGVFIGALKAEGLDDITHCFTDVEQFGEDVYDAIKDFKQGGFNGIKNGIEHVGQALIDVSKGFTDCSSIAKDITKIEAMAEIFASPYTFAWHIGKDLVVNGVDIYRDINAAI